MYETHWGLTENPFQNSLDPRFFYCSKEHKEALDMFSYCIKESLGAAMLTGIFGCGKSLSVAVLLESLGEKYKHAFIRNPNLKSTELLREIVYNLGIKDNLPFEKTDLLHILQETLINNANDGKETLIIIDDAHIIEDKMAFDELRLLLNLQFKDKFLLTLILLGQNELEEKISANKPFSQRIAVKFHLDRLNEEETNNYINFRLKVAGQTKDIFSPDAIKYIFQNSAGIPRRINQLSGLSLFIGSNKNAKVIEEEIVREASKYVVS